MTRVSAVTSTVSRASTAAPGAAGGSTAGLRSRHQSTKATAMMAIESRKCSETNHGLRWVSTVMPPSTACAGMPSSASVASRRSRRSARATRNVAAATTASTNVSCRLVNSMIPWIA